MMDAYKLQMNESPLPSPVHTKYFLQSVQSLCNTQSIEHYIIMMSIQQSYYYYYYCYCYYYNFTTT